MHEIPPASMKQRMAVKAAARLSNACVAVSQAVAELFHEIGDKKVEVVYNGVKLRAAAQPHDPLVVGCIGHICRRKGTDTLLEASRLVMEADQGITFEHLGPSNRDGDVEFQGLVTRLCEGLDGFRFLGIGDPDDVLPGWSMFVLPSRQDPFPLASLEAMSAGLPVIATNVGGLSEQIDSGRTGFLVEPESPEKLAERILRLANDAGERTAIGRAARRSVSERFTFDRQAEGLQAAYLRVLKG
jgi:glycosyltransferase involved in cell wall biosynthesis